MSNIASFLSYFLNLTPSTLVSELGCRVGILLKRIGIELYSSVYIYIYIYIYIYTEVLGCQVASNAKSWLCHCPTLPP